jgi:hypothetical protein
MNHELLLLLKEELELMDKAKNVLMRSYSRCKSFVMKENYSEDEEEKLEALTSRFARLSDILFQKIWKTIFISELEIVETVRDKVNKAEKLSLIDSAAMFEKIRILRNEISHEYIAEEMRKIYNEVFDYSPALFDAVKRANDYVVKKNLV